MSQQSRYLRPGDPFYAQVGDRIRRARQERGLTQGTLAAAVRLTRTSIANIERGRQRLLLHTFAAVARVLNKELAAPLPLHDEAREAHAGTVVSGSTTLPPDDAACS